MTRPVRVLAPLVVLVLAIACSGGGTLRGSVYTERGVRYRIGPLGTGWQPLRVEDHNDLAWRNPNSGAIVQVNATCDPASDVPLTALTNHLLMGFTERDIRAQTLVPLDGREALRTHVLARLDGVAREMLFYVMKKDDCVYDFSLVAPPGAVFERALVEFEPFVQGFTTNVGTTP